MKATNCSANSTARAALLALGLVAVRGNAFAQAPTAQAPAAVVPNAPAAKVAVVAPATPPAPVQAAPAVVLAASANAPAPVAAPAVPPAATPAAPGTGAPVAPAASGPFPLGDEEATAAAAFGPSTGGRFLLPRVAATSNEPIAPSSPPKTRYPIGLEFDVMPVWQKSSGFDLFSSNDIATRVGLSLDFDLFDVLDKTPLSLEIGWATESQSDSLFSGTWDTKLSANHLHGGIKLRYQVLSVLAPHLHLAGGASILRANYSVTDANGTREFESKDTVGFGMLGAGVTATIPTQAAVQPGLVVEGGYLISGSMALRLEPKPDSQALGTTGASLGTLERSGPYLRFGLFIRY